MLALRIKAIFLVLTLSGGRAWKALVSAAGSTRGDIPSFFWTTLLRPDGVLRSRKGEREGKSPRFSTIALETGAEPKPRPFLLPFTR